MKRNFITEIEINKLRHLENINIDLDKSNPKHLLLTGKNGVGKTTVLNALKNWLRIVQNPSIDFKSLRMFQKDSKILENNILNSNNQIEKLAMENQLKEKRIWIDNVSKNGLNSIFSCDEENLRTLYKSRKFILAYYDSKREVKIDIPKGSEKIELKKVYLFDENPSQIFVKYLVDLKTQQSFARNENEIDVVENIEKWFEMFLSALKIVLDDDSIDLNFDYKNYNFKIIQKNREPFGFDELSDGYSSIINIVADLILRMDQNRASNERNYAFDIEGIVLIDEIETHLHIELQRKILPFLTTFFPNIQFIVSTHSPFILNSIEDSVIYDLENNIRMENLSNYSYEGIVEGYFEVDQYSKELKEFLEAK